jgi:putative membrane protein
MAGMQADTDYDRHRKLIGRGVAGLLLLIGIVVLVGAVLRLVIAPTSGFRGFFFFFPFGFFFFFLFLFFVFGWFRWWGWGGWRGYPMTWGYHDGASEILRQRYARGEITKDQFDQMMRDIEQSRAPRP